MSKGLLTPSVVLLSAVCISVPTAPTAFAAVTYSGPPKGVVVQQDPTPIAASLGASIGKATDIKGLAKKARKPRKRVA
jgi:hypothetical protein